MPPGGTSSVARAGPARPPPSPKRTDHIQHCDEQCLMNKHYLKGLRNTMNFSVAKNIRGLIKKCMNFVVDYKSRASRERESARASWKGGAWQGTPAASQTGANRVSEREGATRRLVDGPAAPGSEARLKRWTTNPTAARGWTPIPAAGACCRGCGTVGSAGRPPPGSSAPREGRPGKCGPRASGREGARWVTDPPGA